MLKSKYQQNDVVFLTAKNEVVKGIIEEIIFHYTQKDLIIKYIVRPYGLDFNKCVAVDEEDIVQTYEEAQSVIRERLQLIFKNILEALDKKEEKEFDELEKKYQEQTQSK